MTTIIAGAGGVIASVDRGYLFQARQMYAGLLRFRFRPSPRAWPGGRRFVVDASTQQGIPVRSSPGYRLALQGHFVDRAMAGMP